MSRFDETLAKLHTRGELALFPYLTAGFPSPEVWTDLLEAMVDGGADGFEVGIPFSDPLADGVTMQRANARALEQGMTLERTLTDLARTKLPVPVALMSYVNPLLARGFERLCRDSQAAGVDAFIVPDLPLSESLDLQRACRQHELGYVPLVAPTSTEEHMAGLDAVSAPFVYCVALLGVTGARSDLDPELVGFLGRVRSCTRHPLAVGFGISQAGHVEGLLGHADAAIVGAAVVDLIEDTSPGEAGAHLAEYVRELKAAGRAPAHRSPA